MIRILLFSLCLACSVNAHAFVVAAPAAEEPTSSVYQQIDHDELAAKLGRRLTVKERLAVKAINYVQLRQLRRDNRRIRRGQEPKPRRNPDSNGMAIAGFVMGILGITILPIPMAPLALVFSAIGLRRANREGKDHRGLAIAGLVMGILGTIIVAIVFLILIAALAYA